MYIWDWADEEEQTLGALLETLKKVGPSVVAQVAAAVVALAMAVAAAALLQSRQEVVRSSRSLAICSLVLASCWSFLPCDLAACCSCKQSSCALWFDAQIEQRHVLRPPYSAACG